MATTMFRGYAENWLRRREVSKRSRDNYRRLLTTHLLPAFGSIELCDIMPRAVSGWYATTAVQEKPTGAAHAYSLLRSILQAAVSDGSIAVNPCQLTGVTTAHRAPKAPAATREQIELVSCAMPEPCGLSILMAAWLSMPFSELRELRRRDIDLAAQVVRVRRAVALVSGRYVVMTPKSVEGIRDTHPDGAAAEGRSPPSAARSAGSRVVALSVDSRSRSLPIPAGIGFHVS